MKGQQIFLNSGSQWGEDHIPIRIIQQTPTSSNLSEMQKTVDDLLKECSAAEKELKIEKEKLNRTNDLLIKSLCEKEIAAKENKTLRISRLMAETGILTNRNDETWTVAPNKSRLIADQALDKKILDSNPPEYVKSTIAKRLEMAQDTLNKIEDKKKMIYSLISLNTSNLYPSKMMNDNKIILTEILGLGGFGSVWKAWDFSQSMFVAVKIVKVMPDNLVKKYATHLKREMDIMKETNHKNVVKMFRFFFPDDDTVAYVIEYCGKGNLYEAIRDAGAINEAEARSILKQIIEGLLSLRSKPHDEMKPSEVIIDYDLKPANIVFDDSFTPKICDFGLSKIGDEGKSILQSTPGSGTPGYTAPEAFTNYQKINFSADTWSLGIIFLEMLTGNFEAKVKLIRSDQSQISRIIRSAFTENLLKTTSQEAIRFIETCLLRDPTKRPTVKELSKLPYLNN